MNEELKYQQAVNSKNEQKIFDYQAEMQRKKQQILEQSQSQAKLDEEKNALSERIEALMAENRKYYEML